VRNFKSAGLAREAGPPADDYLELEAVTENDHTLIFPSSQARGQRARGMGAGDRSRLRGHGGEGRRIAVPRRAHPVLAQGEAAKLSERGARVGAEAIASYAILPPGEGIVRLEP
jgi:hypothetical protein